MELGAMRAGDIFWQYAQKAAVTADEEIPPDKIKLVVSDEHGVLSKTVFFSMHIFRTYFQEAESPNLYFRKVQVEGVDDTQVRFLPLGRDGKGCADVQMCKKNLFLDTYFIPQHQMGNVNPS